ncbi:MAG: hypothetical protein QOI53_4273 [Verrucomicrobiota bacterium]|nr:hypothetical protein [Verrucomicrobiota bacterium]
MNRDFLSYLGIYRVAAVVERAFSFFSATLPAFPMLAAAVFRRQSRPLKARIRTIPSAQFTKGYRRPQPILKGIY